MVRVSFEAELWRHDGEGGWHFVTLPVDLAQEVRERAAPGPGFGSVRVAVTLGGSTWSTSVFPDRRSGSYVLPVRQAVRRQHGLEAGDVVRLELEVG